MPAKIPSGVELQLLALVVRERSGIEVADLYERETKTSISPGTLYTTFRRMREAGWVSAQDGVDEDGRIRYFKLTAIGATALEKGRSYYRDLSRFGKSVSNLSARTAGVVDVF
jgi:DNA-binding PadR family transcriptional regulator